LSTKFEARADARALACGLAFGAAVGVALGGAYLAGGMARQADDHTRALRLAGAAAQSFSETALRGEASQMDAGALSIARRHDPFTAAGSPQRDREAAMFASQAIQSSVGPGQGAAMIRASFSVSNPQARPFHLDGGALDSTRDLDCLADAVYYESRGETPAGQAAVAQVVLNRVRHPAFPKSVCGVVFQGAHTGDTCQFSFACDGSMNRPREAGAWQRARQVAAHALAGFVMPSVGNATHFHVVGLDPGWGPRLMKVAQIGLHVFYRFGGNAGAPNSFTAQAEHSAPGSEMAVHPVYASLIPMGGDTADGKPAAPMILANATVTGDASAKPASAPAPSTAVAANSAGHDTAAVVAAAPRASASSASHVDAAPKADAKPEAAPAKAKVVAAL
jgi:spore germination cell wall hydrolase CwlJ-like protein